MLVLRKALSQAHLLDTLNICIRPLKNFLEALEVTEFAKKDEK